MGHEEVNLMLTKRYIKYTNPWEKAKRTRRCYKIAQGILFLKGTVTVMSSDLLFKEEHSLITTSFFSPFSEQWCLRYRRIFNYENFLWCFFSRTVKQHLKMAILNEKRYWVQIIFFRIFFSIQVVSLFNYNSGNPGLVCLKFWLGNPRILSGSNFDGKNS